MVTILAILETSNNDGVSGMNDIIKYFKNFYEQRKLNGKLPEKEQFLMSKAPEVSDSKVKELLLVNPLKALSGFVIYRGDHEQVSFTDQLAKELTQEAKEKLRNVAYKHLYDYYKQFDPNQLTLQQLNNLTLGIPVTATDVSLLSGQNQMKGIHPIFKDNLSALVILCTIGGESYPNEWLSGDKTVLKYYLEGRTDKETGKKTYNLKLPSNKAIIDSRSEGYPLYVFVRDKKGELFHFTGEFLFEKVEENKSKDDYYFILKRKEVKQMSVPDVSKEKIIKAIDDFDIEKRNSLEWLGWEHKKNQKYAILYQDKLYPPKQIISMATGTPVSEFSGGDQANSYLNNKGFEVITLSNGVIEDDVSINEIDCNLAVEKIYRYISNKGLIYELSLIKNFFLSLKTKPFVILAGISGTGKSKLVEVFAECVGATCENGRYCLVPVRPDWNDSADLLGYKDINGKFIPGPLTRVIQRANGELDKPFFVCLDEMNLSRVEHYLSDILSLMETKKNNEFGSFSEKLFHSEYFIIDEDKHLYANLRIPPNFYVIGTVNMDETTFPFSKKVLDRANTIEFSTVHLKSFPYINSQDVEPIIVGNKLFVSKFHCLKDCHDSFDYLKTVTENLDKINSILSNANLHVGYRVRDEICYYMTYNKIYDLLEEDDAFDYQIMQKILPRIQGSTTLIFNVLVNLFQIATGKDYRNQESGVGELALRYVQENEIIKPYPRSAAKIATMLWRFDDGFTSFWL